MLTTQMHFEKSLVIPTLKLRWFTCNCYQFILPNGKSILTDPFLPAPDSVGWQFPEHYCGYLPEDLGSLDYVILNHTHGDHIGTLPEIYNMYLPRIFGHVGYAYQLCLDLDIPQRKVFPYENEHTYHFNDFTLETFTARHGGPENPKPPSAMVQGGPADKFTVLNQYGTLFNTDFILTTSQGVRIGFCSGVFDENERYEWKDAKIDVLIRQCPEFMRSGDYAELAEQFMGTGAKILLPLHHEHPYDHHKPYDQIDCVKFVENVNTYLAEKEYIGRMILLERGKWYNLTTGIFCE